jgi:hypothetical protein
LILTEPKKAAPRGRPRTGKAKSSTERGKSADDALVQSGGLILNKLRLSPEAVAALAQLVALDGTAREAIQLALIERAKNL